MHKFACLMGLLFLVSFSAAAQDMTKVDLFGGYTYLRFRPNAPNVASAINYNGGVGSIAYNLNSYIAGVAEFAGYHAGTINNANGVAFPGYSSNAVSYLFGPKLYMNSGKLTPFVQVLFGGAHGSITGPFGSSSASSTVTTNTFAMALGGGLDWNVMPHVAVRLAQVEYVMTRYGNTISNGLGTGGTGTQNNFRYSGGIVLRF